MTFIPKAFCACGCEMLIEKTGARIECIALIGSYYKIPADLYRCPKCGAGVYTGMPGRPWVEHFEDGYADKPVDAKVIFSEVLRAGGGS